MRYASDPERRRASVPAAALALGVLACSAPPPLPMATVERRDFVHRVSAEGHLRADRVTPVAVPSTLRWPARIVWLAPNGTEVETGDVVARFDRFEMELQLEDGETELRSSELQKTEARVDGESKVRSVDTQREVAELELEIADRFLKNDAAVFSRNEIVESEIDAELARVRRRHAEGLSRVQGEVARQQLELLDIEGRKAELEVERAEQALSALDVRAPRSGLLIWRPDWRGELPQLGDVVFGGHPMGEIPDLSSMVGEVFVLEADAAALAVGQHARMWLEAHPERVYEGRVERVESVARRLFRDSPVQYFGVTLSVGDLDVAATKPGQRLRATIELGRAEHALVVPRPALFRDDEGVWALVLVDGELRRRAVRVGDQSPALAVILDGLEEGDRVALEAPPGELADVPIAGATPSRGET